MTEILQRVKANIKQLDFQPWPSVASEDIELTKITGGLTNVLYKASILKKSESVQSADLVVRIFGLSDGLLNRGVENEIFRELSAQGISPKLIGTYEWGRLEEYLTANHPLASGTDMMSVTPERDSISLIAGSLRSLHRVKLRIDSVTASANIFHVLRKWLSLASKFGDKIRGSPKCPQFAPPSIEIFQQEVEFVENILQLALMKNPAVVSSGACKALLSDVVCHNDLLSGNIMLDPVRNSLRLIDFEYSGINVAVADIANVFTAVCESIMLSGQPQDVERNFPSREKQLHFLARYLDYSVPDNEQEAVLLTILGFAMADELRWSIWGTIQAEQSVVDFDYVFYYNSRFDAYKVYKRLFQRRLAALPSDLQPN